MIATITGSLILGFLMRFIIHSASVIIVRLSVNKKKRKKITLEIKDKNTKKFIGIIAIISFFYFLAIDISKGYLDPNEFNSFIWIGMFIPNLILLIENFNKKSKSKNKPKIDYESINEKNAFHMNKMLGSIK